MLNALRRPPIYLEPNFSIAFSHLLSRSRVEGAYHYEHRRSPKSQEEIDPIFDDMYYNAGSVPFSPQGGPRHRLLRKEMPPVESDGPDDTNERSMFEEHLPNDAAEEKLNDRDHLSKMLEMWCTDKVMPLPNFPPAFLPSSSPEQPVLP
ncbi:uncharacterized protein Z519_06042 [Cladophialophora bantiana CBS 173.52]|uniref:Unplaced genomic scaffold supercont1.8, whole genome shotgun sequence n=1 Tax=Cladophialophora bantiana (strain ATCC 10958 / CBS 173.52 / CDC B-1940 / NIH 8579) TaxID=1442370 RepID=A0A0D2G445_CLAB1|nr:uncharacterized protein Z519_06042 [Cladophialophora bantiana CBS 173.52]KIW93437.1 hypothetical protein Z519_06042 [Cladophialophora bantiana CBS 173.52]